MDGRPDLGRTGEDLAAEHYSRAGYRVVDRNFRCKLGEIDLVAAQGRTIVFVEVKTRRTDYFGEPAEAVTPAKQCRLRRLAAQWLLTHEVSGATVRFDVMSIVLDGRTARVTQLQDAF